MEQISVALSAEAPRYIDRGKTARFGLIVLATDLTSERDFYRQLPDNDVAIHVARVAFENPTTPDNLRKMTPRLAESASLLAAAGPLRAVCYSCTAASVVIGDQTVRSAIQVSLPGVPVITPTRAARHAFSALDVKRIAVLTPYTVATSEPMADYFQNHDLEIVRFECLGVDDDRDMARLSDETIVNAAIAADHRDAQALFISCTALPVIGLIGQIEERIGKPVVTSNQASVWAMSRAGGLADHSPQGFGSLYHRALSAQDTS